jgi:hypothetical protein
MRDPRPEILKTHLAVELLQRYAGSHEDGSIIFQVFHGRVDCEKCLLHILFIPYQIVAMLIHVRLAWHA